MWVELFKEEEKVSFMNRLNVKAVAALRGKYKDIGSLYLHRRKESGVQWIVRYILAGL
ncbi:DUF4102 domain-containing protein [Bartonella gliris]|uniref:DUF4102 domain-containing protein n=1 Tax=Bartonella gliris TaxID=3004109 RepID=UPI003872D075